MKPKIYLDWNEIEMLVDRVCNKIITDLPYITSILGISRGGLIPAVWISHKLNIPYTHKIDINTLIVDDICDTGVTIQNHSGSYFATLLHKPTAIVEPDVYGKLFKGDEWVVFPWEVEDAPTIQDYLKQKEI